MLLKKHETGWTYLQWLVMSDDALSMDTVGGIDNWCTANIGDAKTMWEPHGGSGWRFEYEEDAVRFMLTWG